LRNGYRAYALRRVFHLVWVYVVLVYVFSLLLNVQIELQERRALEFNLRGEMYTENLSSTGAILPVEEIEQQYQAKLQAVLHERGYDLPFLGRVNHYAVRVLCFDFGETLMSHPVYFRAGENALSLVGQFVVPTLVVFTSAFLVQMAIGIWLGMRNASRPKSLLDRATTIMATLTGSVPPAVAAMVVMLVLAVAVPAIPKSTWIFSFPERWSEVGSWAAGFFSHATAPFLTVAFLTVWQTAHTVRNIALPTLQEEYIAADRGRGLPERLVLYRHSLRASAPALATMLLVGLTATLWGSFLVEPIFQWRGVGTLMMWSIAANEINILMALLAVFTLASLFCQLVLDLAYGWLDPRIRVGGQPS
jgi:peptide/nickel transport system permease protein